MNTDSQWSKQEACFACATRCQSLHQCHFWRMNSMFEVYCSIARASELGSCQIYFFHEAMKGFKNLDSLKACFENVNIE